MKGLSGSPARLPHHFWLLIDRGTISRWRHIGLI
jgi:hypothetical protein